MTVKLKILDIANVSYDKNAYKLFFGTLNNEIRLQIIHALIKRPKNVTQLTKELGFDHTTISKNLKRLETCGFVHKRKKEKFSVYSLNKKPYCLF